MTSPTGRRHASGAMPVMPWIICAVIGLLFAGMGFVWLAAQLTAESGFAVPGYLDLPTALRRSGLDGVIGAGGSRAWFAIVVVVQVAALFTAAITGMVWWARRRRPRDGRLAMNTPRQFADLHQAAMAERAQNLNASLARVDRASLTPQQIGAKLGDIGGTNVYKSHEDVELVICGPRSNKTSAKVVPEVLAARGLAVVTSNKPDVWILTGRLRARVGPVYLFDPMRITYQQQGFWVDLLGLVTDVESATRVATYFMREVGGGSGQAGGDRADPFFTPAAAKTLRQLLLAAACAKLTLREVQLWVATRSAEPTVHLERSGHAAQAASLRSTLELAPETKGGIFEGVSTALACLDSEALLRWVTPPASWQQPPDDPDSVLRLDLWTLIAEREHPASLYLLSREGESSGRPVVAAIVGELVNVAVQAASARGGRLDPVATLQLDEAANICRIPDLPSWYSWFGSMGLMVTVILQSREQGRSVWGREGFDALWSAATIKTIGAGVQDADFVEELSRLIGDHKIEETSTSYSNSGTSTSRSLRTERILTAADIAALSRTQALLFTSGRRPAQLSLHPWYSGDDEDKHEITANSQAATAQVQDAAITYLGPDNPVAAALQRERQHQRKAAG
ncbi:hypothetical protein GCM10022247_34920 [Allokutzneria multivorans]|uniref:TraD/TraG TraM recognition site domain-containing protein n=1 Tax=Allokutzneria multivorans TaxID=1142134 RepID=A0ABP7SCK5_9PSEU